MKLLALYVVQNSLKGKRWRTGGETTDTSWNKANFGFLKGRYFYSGGGQAVEQVAQKGHLHPWRCSKPAGSGSGQPAPIVPTYQQSQSNP